MLINKTTSPELRTLLDNIVNKLEGLNKSRKNFIVSTLLLYLCLRGRYTFLGLARYGDYCEQSYRNHYQQPFDWFELNWDLVHPYLSDERILVFDPSYIPKSGKATPHIDKFWSGCLGKAVKGLELGVFGVVDIEKNTAFHLQSIQTASPKVLTQLDLTLPDYYLDLVVCQKNQFEKVSEYLVVDGYFAKKGFVKGIKEQTDFTLITKLRVDANLRYLYKGPYSGKGRPKEFDGKVDLKNIDKRRFKKLEETEDEVIYTCVCNVVNLKCNGRIVYVQFKKQGKLTGKYAVYFCEDVNLDGQKVYQYYKARFQIEFLIRDGKQHTGLTHCQARSIEKLDFHFNASLTAVNLAKITQNPTMENQQNKPFSMANVKTLKFNELMLNRFFSIFQVDKELKENKNKIQEALEFGSIAA